MICNLELYEICVYVYECVSCVYVGVVMRWCMCVYLCAYVSVLKTNITDQYR